MKDRFKLIERTLLSKDWGTLTKAILDYQRRDGRWQRMSREVYDHGNAAAILLFNPKADTVLLVRQFRYPVALNGDDSDFLEVCAGLLDGDAPQMAVAREALEETGHVPLNISHVCDIYASPGSLTEKCHLFIGHYDETTRQTSGGGLEEEGEEIELVELSFGTALAMIGTGQILDAKTIVLLQHLAMSRR